MNSFVSTIPVLIAKYLEGTLAPSEQAQLDEWLMQSPDNQSFFDQATEPAALQELWQQYNSTNTESALHTVKSKLGIGNSTPGAVRRVSFVRTSWFRYAAILLLIAGAGTLLYVHNRPQSQQISNPSTIAAEIPAGGNKAILTLSDGRRLRLDDAANGQLALQGNTQILKTKDGSLRYQAGGHSDAVAYNTLTTPKGGQYQIVLPDGTGVWLNASSSIRFPTAFTGTVRTVEVTGEVYMEVAPMASQAFMVKAADVDIRVLGTSFNINAYGDMNRVEATLLTGRVSVADTKAPTQTVLQPGQRAQVSAGGQAIDVSSNVDLEQTVAWKNGFFNFSNLPLAAVMKQLERWYDIQVVYEDGVPGIELAGNMTRDVPLQGLLKGLAKLGLRARLEGTRLIIMNSEK